MTRRREIVWLHDIAADQVDAIGHGFFDIWTDERLDQSETFGFELAASHAKADRLAPDLELTHRGRRYYVAELEHNRNGTETTVAVEAAALWYRLGGIIAAGEFGFVDTSVARGLTLILADTGWTVGTDTDPDTDDIYTLAETDKSVLALIRTWAKITGRYVRFDTAEKTVSLTATRGAELGLGFQYGRNLTGIRRRVRPPELTRLYAYGAQELTIAGVNGGLEYVEDLSYYTGQGLSAEEAAALYTRARSWSDTSFIVDTDLLAAAEAKLAAEAVPIVNYEIKVIDLAEFSGVLEECHVADTVRVFDPEFGDEVRPIVTRYRRHWLQPWRNQIELSTTIAPSNDGSTAGRPDLGQEWQQFVGPVRSAVSIRSDGEFDVARIPLRFVAGQANFHVDLALVAAGDGVAHVTVVDALDEYAVQWRGQDVTYTDGETITAHLSWAMPEIEGAHDYRVRVTTTADGGPSPSNGVDTILDPDDPVAASFWILARGAVQETPTFDNVARFDYITQAAQSWTVPAGVTQVRVTLAGAEACTDSGMGGKGCMFSAIVDMVPGTVYDVYAPSGGRESVGYGWPYGGPGGGGSVFDSNPGRDGGGLAAVVPAGQPVTNAILIAGGGGGSVDGPPLPRGGHGGFLAGHPGIEHISGDEDGGQGGTQSAGGAKSPGNGTDGARLQGGTGQTSTTGGLFGPTSGGGGGGHYGGGGGGDTWSGGGGGSSYIDPALNAFDVLPQDGYQTGHGFVQFEWENPDV